MAGCSDEQNVIRGPESPYAAAEALSPSNRIRREQATPGRCIITLNKIAAGWSAAFRFRAPESMWSTHSCSVSLDKPKLRPILSKIEEYFASKVGTCCKSHRVAIVVLDENELRDRTSGNLAIGRFSSAKSAGNTIKVVDS